MWFNNALIYQYDLPDDADLSAALLSDSLKPCPPHARFIYGWLPASFDHIIHEVAGSTLICMGKEERILPRAVINKFLAEKIQTLETQQGRKVKRSERAQLAEDIEFDLLPKSFCIQKRMSAILDYTHKKLIINSASANQATQLISLLRKSVKDLVIEPLAHTENLALRFAQWIHTPESIPANFQLASDCLLFSLDDEKKRISCKGYELPAEEVLTLLSQGMATAEISLIWKERIQLTLTQDFVLKRLKSLDYLVDEFNELSSLDEEQQQEDAALTLLSGELRELIQALLTALKPEDSNQTSLLSSRPIEEIETPA